MKLPPNCAARAFFDSDAKIPETPEIKRLLNLYETAAFKAGLFARQVVGGRAKDADKLALAFKWETVCATCEHLLVLAMDDKVGDDDFASSPLNYLGRQE